ncbi:dihydroorotate dehydrogenase (quinone), mitochondrial [Phlebotomus papatasi]|uniref:dihydroorotate dehydrogenase (quinone), mitochondrial n=1 Tax=Phlebotomus papatasi TaxID=29031 RepID=UPI002483CD54|nr:dihydroorotate dehydrogenase (quinone), mitochondrial [Phlebotomus papatasi]
MLKMLRKVTAIGGGVFGISALYFTHSGNEKFYNKILMPIVHNIPAELSHNIALLSCKYGIMGQAKYEDSERLKTTIFDMNLSNPVGIAAGFDKQGEAVRGLYKLGFGFVEIGSITPNPQPGNPKPRCFRLLEDKALINRFGFNSDGHQIVYERIRDLRENKSFKGIIGINLGKNKTSTSASEDYSAGIELFGPVADYLVVNISSPNTPGLRSFQSKEKLKELLADSVAAKRKLSRNVPLLLKITSDLIPEELNDISEIIQLEECRVDGLIVSNTTIARPSTLQNENREETGGLSGAPLSDMATKAISHMYRKTGGKIPIIGVGGIFSGKDAYEKILAGSSAVQIYTSFALHGPPLVNKIKRELDEILQKNGFKNVAEAKGMAHADMSSKV